MSLMRDRHWGTRKFIAPFLYASAAVATANWLDYAFASFEPYGYPALLWITLSGSALFVLACLISFFRDRYAVFLALTAACLSWPYFAVLAWYMPWSRLIWMIRIHDHGVAQVAAIFMLLAATVFSLIRFGSSLRSVPARLDRATGKSVNDLG